eukprot:TRINITY_DN6061_c0_g1_i1.p1 TRINITY_DN6061_c0_g1~~TRINITY_DN6061_c0_g1_i1.p1  ORF type:complete len:660 (-),score=112.79 TRINITY_DN6061_c0_g1_i1:326-2281(-)
MAAKGQKKQSMKRKHATATQKQEEKPFAKKAKHFQSKTINPKTKTSEPAIKPPKKGEEESKRDRRLVAKELAEARKKKRKPHYNLQQELASVWEKMRRRNIAKDERSKLISEALRKMRGKIPEIASSHVSSRVLQTCVKYCSQAERDFVFEELRPHLLSLARNTYAVHLVKKMLDNASKIQLEGFISSLHGQVASLLRHMVGSVVVEHAFQLGNGSQKQGLLLELYSTELQLFKDLTSMNAGRLVDLISKLGLQKSSVQVHMTSVIQPILEKGIIDHSIIHSALMEYFSIADRSSATDVIQQLSGPLLVRMIHTRDGSKVGMLCVKHGSAKERKKIIKGMKEHIGKIARDQYGYMVLVSILSLVDDTKLITKIAIRELQSNLKDLVLDKNGRRPLLQLLHPHCPRYFSPDELESLNLSVPSLSVKGEGSEVSIAAAELEKQTKSLKCNESDHMHAEEDADVTANDTDNTAYPRDNLQLLEGGKKDPSLRRFELLVNNGLAESLIDTCIENAGELLRSNFGKEVIYEVATGGAGSILRQTLSEKLGTLYEAIASIAALSKTEESDGEHVFENFHSSRTIRKLVLDCPTFATTLWKSALEGKCEMWVQGHSCKVVSAFLESSNFDVRNLAKRELQPLIDGGILKVPETKRAEK